jgi:glycosyltransferase involved in cell wall biosynthesis
VSVTDGEGVVDRSTDGRPGVSLVITTRDRARLLAEAIESALALDQSRFVLEIIVVDDGSTDETAAVLNRYPVRVLHGGGAGVQAARDLGLSAATGSYVIFLDDDDVLLPDAITAQLAVFDEHPEYGAVHGQYQLADENLHALGPTVPAPPLTSGWILSDLLAYAPQIATVVTRTDLAREVGPFDRSVPGGEDWDWILRVAGRHQVGRVAAPVMQFRTRTDPEEELDWKRFPALVTIFRRHTRDLPFAERVRVRPKLWRQRGFFAWRFIQHAEQNWKAGRRDRTARSLAYAFRCSPPHALASLGRTIRRHGTLPP